MEQEININTKNKKIGLLLLVGPIMGVILSLIVIVILQSISAMIGINPEITSTAKIIIYIINWIFALIGLISIIIFPIGIPVGIIFLTRRNIIPGVLYDERSGNGESSVVPAEIKGWNWGAAGLPFIWGLSHRVWIALLALVPFANIVMWIILGLKGNEWAWKAQKWENIETFISYQKKWKPWGIIFFILSVLSILFSLLGGALGTLISLLG